MGLVGSGTDPKSRGVVDFNRNDEGESAPFVSSSCEAADGRIGSYDVTSRMVF